MKRIINLVLMIIILAGLFSVPHKVAAYALVYFVAPAGTDSACTESHPCSLQTAASLGTAARTIYMQEGTYTGTGEAVAVLTKTTQIIGSCVFDSNDATDPVCGYEDSHRSIIDGQSNRRGLVLTGDDTGSGSFYIYNVDIYYGDASDADTSQCSTDLGTSGGCGGGMFIDLGATIFLSGIRFAYNQAGGSDPAKAGMGGGVYVQNSTNVTITESIFDHNNATVSGLGFGGAVFATGISGEMNILDSRFSQNTCTTTVEALSMGCGVMVRYSENVSVNNNYFSNNNPLTTINAKGSGVFLQYNDGFDVWRNTFTLHPGVSVLGADNSSNTGMDTIDANLFMGNSAAKLIQYEGKYWVKITNNILTYLLAPPTRGGASSTAIDLSSNYITPIKSIANIYHNTISNAAIGMDISNNMMAFLYNNIIANTDVAGISLPVTPSNLVTQTKTNLFYNNHGVGGDGIYDPTSVYANPLFVNPSVDLHITWASPAIDRATSGWGVYSDFDGQVRPNGGFDIGADEACGRFFLPVIYR